MNVYGSLLTQGMSSLERTLIQSCFCDLGHTLLFVIYSLARINDFICDLLSQLNEEGRRQMFEENIVRAGEMVLITFVLALLFIIVYGFFELRAVR